MLPDNTEYSNFVPDQLLTSEDLNSLFRYLDEQGRMSRTNLVGIGILCGLELRTSSDGTAISVTKGTGVTSEGYLVSLDDAQYSRYVPFEPVQEIHYDKFVDGAGNPRLQLWELKREAAVQGSTPLSFDFLNGAGDEDHRKIVLVFVELYLELDKNCNPESCDDMGQTIHVNQRVLLARKMDVEDLGLNAGLGSSYFHDGFAALPRLALPRFNVPASRLTSAAGIFTAYKKLLPAADVAALGGALSALWNLAKDDVAADYGTSNPFAGLANPFALLNGGPISAADLISLQYLYDHYADLLAAYEEIREEGMRAIGVCCPDSALFPRHLLLGTAIDAPHLVPRPARHGFQASPIHHCDGGLGKLRSLFRRLVLMVQSFKVPVPLPVTGKDPAIRITPSRLGPRPLSVKAIPWYYPATSPAVGPFFTWWNYAKTRAGEADTNLGYHAPAYASRADVKNPLAYDLEPYNFLRIEGHVGKPVAHVLSNLQDQVLHRRLPIQIVALALGNDASGTHIADPAALMALHAQFETLKAEIVCCLRAQARYWAKLDTGSAFKRPGNARDYGMLRWIGSRESFGLAARDPKLGLAQMRAMSMASPDSAPQAASRATAEDALEPHSISSQYLANTKKGQDLVANLGDSAVGGIGRKWLGYVDRGDVNLGFIPAPEGPTFDAAQLEHWALIVLDQIEELIVALEAENLLSLDIDTIETHRDSLAEALETLSKLIAAHLAAQIPVAILKTYLGESYHDEAELLGALMLGMTEADAHTLAIIFVNVSESEASELIRALGQSQGNYTAQHAAVQAAYARLDSDGIMVPARREVIAENDPFFAEMRDRLRNFACLCSIESFRKLRETLARWIEQMKGLNLFVNFAQTHPGIQHKAGVPLGGTFVVVYHRASKAGSNQAAKSVAKKLGIEIEAPDQGPVDPALHSASEAISEGTVIADFYLPYLCCSDQPPIQFQVLENAAPPENVTLMLEPNADTDTLDYSVGDSGLYDFVPFPPGGTLDNAIPDLGVVSPAAGSWQFRPAMTATRIDNDDTLPIAFTYSRQGVSSSAVAVTVHNLPGATIRNDSPQDEYTVGDKLLLSSVVVRAQTLQWVIETPSGATQSVADVSELASFALGEAGLYVFQLHATQVATGRVALSNRISVFAQSVAVLPSLTLEPNSTTGDLRYSIGDKRSYAFAYSPAGGSLQGASPEVGVTPGADGGHIFIPANASAKIGSQDMLTVDFTYVVDGARSDSVRARIFALPAVTIAARPIQDVYAVGDTVTWVADVKRAERFNWTVVTPEGKTSKSPGDRQLSVPLPDAGEWTFRVEVLQITTGWVVSSNVETIRVLGRGVDGGGGRTTPGVVIQPDVVGGGGRTAPGVVIQPGVAGGGRRTTPGVVLQPDVVSFRGGDSKRLGLLVAEYERLAELDPDGFDLFKRRVLEAMGVEERFSVLRELAGASEEQAREVFQVDSQGSWVAPVLDIMEQILTLLANARSKVSKTLLIQMYRLLGKLLLDINAISAADLNSEQSKAMDALLAHVHGGGAFVGFGALNLGEREKGIVLDWKSDVEAALAELVAGARAGATKKPAYESQLRKLAKGFE